jgi:dUTP pyrophosphatase
MSIKFKKLDPRAVTPTRATDFSAGFDLSALVPKGTGSVCIPPQESRMIPTGIAFEIPEGHVGLLFGRSGLGCKSNLRPANCVGVIDSDYRGEVKVCLYNDSNKHALITDSLRIAQMVIVPCSMDVLEEVDDLNDTVRGDNGFGSTGK